MSEPKVNDRMEKIVSLCKRRGFIFQSSEIYGGINGFWDYGPLGAELKRNIKDYWWRCLTQARDDIAGLEASIIMHPKIWEASGHTSTFSDLMVECRACRRRMRVDQIDDLLQEARFLKPLEKLFNRFSANRSENSGKDFANLGEAMSQWVKMEGRGVAPNLAAVLDQGLSVGALQKFSGQGPIEPRAFRDFLRAVATPGEKQETGRFNDPCPHCGGELDD